MRNVTFLLDDGSRFCGKSFGYEKPVAGEVVFNTAMSGYPESLTDPSYAGQLLTLTYPLVGNYGVPPFTVEPNGLPTFMESERIHAEAIIVSDYSENYSHWNSAESLGDWLKREHNFTQEVSTTETLSSTAARQNIISQLIQAAQDVGMDGINVDFESLSEDVGTHFLEFLRELSIECHKNNLVLSVDNPVPEDFTSHYDRAEQGRVVDYVIIMGYDEHYVGSEAGSVASLPWVEQGIQDTLDEVPAERVINAIPFYTRLWRTTGGNVTSEAIGMDQAQQTIADNNVETYWDKTTSQNYGKYDIDNSTYQIWLEDAQSVAEKVKLVSKYDLAGVSAWKLGFENNGIWQVISDNLNN